MAGYSQTPLAKKLGIKTGGTVFVQEGPAHYRELLEPLPEEVKFVSILSPAVDVIHIFSKSRVALAAALEKALKKMRANASIWVSWPKKASKVETDITEDAIRNICLPMGLVDIKVCAVNEVWSGLKLVIRVENRAGARKTAKAMTQDEEGRHHRTACGGYPAVLDRRYKLI